MCVFRRGHSRRSRGTDTLEVTAPRGKQAPGDLVSLKLSFGESMIVPSCGEHWVDRRLHEFGRPGGDTHPSLGFAPSLAKMHTLGGLGTPSPWRRARPARL